jgi:hypothetical protein
MLRNIAVALAVASITYAGTAFAQQQDSGAGLSGGPSGGDNTVSAGQCRSANPPILCDNAINMNIPDVQMEGDWKAGAALPEGMEATMIEGSQRYAVVSVNGQRLLIDTQTNTIVDVL